MSINFGVGLGFSAQLGFGLGLPLQYPLVNGFAYSWASVEFKFAGSPIITIQSIDYKISNEAKQLYGTNPNPLATTRGKITNSAKCKILLAEGQALISALGQADPTGNNAYGDIFFDTNVTYAEAGNNVISDTLRYCRIYSFDQASAEGPEAIMVEFELNPLVILRNGQPMSSSPLGAPQFP